MALALNNLKRVDMPWNKEEVNSRNVYMKIFWENVRQESRWKKYWISAGLFYPIHHIYQFLHQVISIFFILYKILWMSKNVFKKIS